MYLGVGNYTAGKMSRLSDPGVSFCKIPANKEIRIPPRCQLATFHPYQGNLFNVTFEYVKLTWRREYSFHSILLPAYIARAVFLERVNAAQGMPSALALQPSASSFQPPVSQPPLLDGRQRDSGALCRRGHESPRHVSRCSSKCR